MNIKDLIFIRHILEQIENIEESTDKLIREKFNLNKNLKDATIRRIEIIGEAVKNISEELKKSYPEVEWKNLAGIRDKLIHKYFEIDWNIVWGVIQNDIKILKEQMTEIKKALKTK